jgi:hypothetical protein
MTEVKSTDIASHGLDHSQCHRANPLTRQTHKGLATKFIATLRELSVVQFKPVLERENSLHTTAEIFRAL